MQSLLGYIIYSDMKVRRVESRKRSSLSTVNTFSLIHLFSFPLFAKIIVVFAFCVCKVLLKAQLLPIAMLIDCWKTCSSTYTNVNSSTKSLGKIVKYISPKLTDYYMQMGRKICQCICRCPSIDEKNEIWVCRSLPIHEKHR